MNAFKDFSQSVYSQFGMRIIILGGYQNQSSGEPEVVLYVWTYIYHAYLTSCYSYDMNDRLGGTSFKARHDWENNQVTKDFTHWISESFGLSLFPRGRTTLMRHLCRVCAQKWQQGGPKGERQRSRHQAGFR
jgi:hypothetical protein